MKIGKVVGTVICTRKTESLIGSKFLIVDIDGIKTNNIVAVDNVGAGIGETVLVTTGSSARVGDNSSVVDALIVGIVDSVN